jgi:hypothetical protein
VPELRRSDLAEDPLEQFRRWFEEARGAVRIPEAMALATAAADGDPSVRMVLLKGADERGFAALLTLAPQFSDWAIRREAAETAANAADQLARPCSSAGSAPAKSAQTTRPSAHRANRRRWASR